jgi:dihydropyrimidinase
MTFLRGEIVFREGNVVGKRGYGQFIRRKPCSLPFQRRMGKQWNVLQAAL